MGRDPPPHRVLAAVVRGGHRPEIPELPREPAKISSAQLHVQDRVRERINRNPASREARRGRGHELQEPQRSRARPRGGIVSAFQPHDGPEKRSAQAFLAGGPEHRAGEGGRKPEPQIERLVRASHAEDSLVLDTFHPIREDLIAQDKQR